MKASKRKVEFIKITTRLYILPGNEFLCETACTSAYITRKKEKKKKKELKSGKKEEKCRKQTEEAIIQLKTKN